MRTIHYPSGTPFEILEGPHFPNKKEEYRKGGGWMKAKKN